MVVRNPGGSWYQTGIVSFGSNRCGIGQPAAYTKVSAYIEWIKATLKD